MGATQVTVTTPHTRPIRTEPGKGCSSSTRGPPTLWSRARTWSRSVSGPRVNRVYKLADGSETTMEITVGEIEFMGETVGGTILFGEADRRAPARGPPPWRP